MRTNCAMRGWRTPVGVAAAALLICSSWALAAPPGQGANSDTVLSYPDPNYIPAAPPVKAYFARTVEAREGVGVTPLSMDPLQGSTNKAGGCRANSDCDDCNPCTTDICTVVPPAILGTCSAPPANYVSTCGACGDQVFCNGPELCNDVGQCQEATPGLPCSEVPGTVCDELGGPAQLGECLTPCQNAGDCDDGLECTGEEFCQLQECVGGISPAAGTACTSDGDCDTGNGGFCGGVCRTQNLPCGLAAACKEGFCSAGENAGISCDTNGDCGIGGVCQVGADCVVNGRCCVDDGSGDFLTCSRSNRPDCLANSGRWLFIGDDPGADGDQANCNNPAGPTLPNAGETFNCPNYASGIDSEVPLSSMVPVGKAGAAACNALQEIGDDYELTGLGPDEYLEVTTFRFIGGFQTDGIPGSPSRIRVTFYDGDGNFIEDTITNPQVGGGSPQLRTIIYAENPKIPANGFVAIKAAVRFSPFGKHTWMGGLGQVDTGVNNPNIMWKNGAAVDASEVMGGTPGSPDNPGVLAFEIVGNVVPNPSGACCDSVSGNCDLVLPWKCELPRCSHDQNILCSVDADCGGGNTCLPSGFFQGSEAQCQACQNNEFTNCSAPSDCPGCAGIPGFCVDAPGQDPCNVDADCIPFGGTTCTPQPCDPDSDCPGGGVCTAGTCVGGSNGGGACSVDVDCGAGTCTAQAACNPVPPACTLQACCPDVSDGTCSAIGSGESCPVGSTSRGFGTNCDPNLCEQTLGGHDTCAEASDPANVYNFDVTSISGCETLVWTATGDNLNATFGDFVGDGSGTCEFGQFAQNSSTQDRGWWHAFNINACANVRMDFCGTAEISGEVKQPAWANLYAECNPCGATISANVVGGLPEGGCVGTVDASGDRGGPFCARDDLWETYGPLPAGTYWYPVFSGAQGTFGKYQIHFTVSACPRAACCLPEDYCVKVDDSLAFDGGGAGIPCSDDTDCAAEEYCDNDLDTACTADADCPACVGGPTPDAACTVDADCGTGGTCTGTSTCRAATCSSCALVNTFDCAAVEGKWNGFGNTRGQCPNGECVGGTCVGGDDDGFECFEGASDPVTTCDTDPCEIGSCCTGPALCDDRSNPGVPCNPGNPSTCLTRADCTVGTFRGGAGCSDLISPCPACDIIGATNCQFPLGNGLTYLSDLSLGGNGVTVADDFEPSGTTLNSVCVWGTYTDPSGPSSTGESYEEFSCVGLTVGETFRVRIFQDGANDSDPSTEPGLPGALVGESLVSGNNIVSGPEKGTNLEITFGIVMQSYTLVLDTPITGLSVAERHWIEVVNYTPEPEGNTCWWSWAMHIPEGREGHVAVGISPDNGNPDDLLARESVYVNGSSRGGLDMAFCLDMDFNSPDDPIGACWTCANPPGCTPRTLSECTLQVGMWDRSDPDCLNPTPPDQPNDFCSAGSSAVARVASLLTCGDGIIDPGEQCDDNNTLPDDGCDENCQLECTADVTGGGAGALKITDGLYPFDNACANVDGPTLVNVGGNEAMDGDIWYEYTSSCTGRMVVDMCATQTAWNRNGYSGIDSELGLYHVFETVCDGGSNDGATCVCPGNPAGAKCVDATQCPGTVICDENGEPPGCSNGAIGMCRNVCPCPGAFDGVSPFQHGIGSDEGCNGYPDAGSGFVERTVFPNECWLIRVGAWMPAGSAPGTGNRGRGLMSVGCEAQLCFPSSPPVSQQFTSSTGTQTDYIKARAITVSGGDAGRAQALRVTWKSMPPGWESWEGQSLYAQQPVCGSELGGTPWYDDLGCPPGPGELQVAELGCIPFFTDWSTIGDVHLIHEAIAPSKLVSGAGPVDIPAVYEVQFVDESCALGLSGSFSDALETRTAGWGDNSELFAGNSVVPGDKVTVADTLGMVNKFAGVGGPTKAAADMLGVTTGQVPRLDGKITVNDTVATLGAFGGSHYIFTEGDISPPPGTCPP